MRHLEGARVRAGSEDRQAVDHGASPLDEDRETAGVDGARWRCLEVRDLRQRWWRADQLRPVAEERQRSGPGTVDDDVAADGAAAGAADGDVVGFVFDLGDVGAGLDLESTGFHERVQALAGRQDAGLWLEEGGSPQGVLGKTRLRLPPAEGPCRGFVLRQR